ncbi:hypothetical protein [Streptomyces adustus]
MTPSPRDRSRSVVAAGVFTVIAVAVFVVVPAVAAGVPDAWWPRTGQAFTASPATARHDSCARIVGPAKKYCEHGATTTASGRQDVGGGAWRLLPAGAGAAAFVVWRLRRSAGRRRR